MFVYNNLLITCINIIYKDKYKKKILIQSLD